jgi:hypothetical protein
MHLLSSSRCGIVTENVSSSQERGFDHCNAVIISWKESTSPRSKSLWKIYKTIFTPRILYGRRDNNLWINKTILQFIILYLLHFSIQLDHDHQEVFTIYLSLFDYVLIWINISNLIDRIITKYSYASRRVPELML